MHCKKIKRTFIIVLFHFFCLNLNNAQVVKKIGTNSNQISNTAVLELESSKKGFLPPRMTDKQIKSILNPATGLIVYCINCGLNGEIEIYNGIRWNNIYGGASAIPNTINSVYNFITNKFWMDGNLGAKQAAISSTDINSYGYLYQWGRQADEHQRRTSSTSTTLITAYNLNSLNFIINQSSPFDWLSTQNDNLWSRDELNNPCPLGFHVPTLAEWQTEISSWSELSSNGAINSALKLPLSGYRTNTSVASIINEGVAGYYWSSTIYGTNAISIYFDNAASSAIITNNPRGYGLSVRCIMN
jgi:uncharacterized protein (TIGR02145 family)